MKTSICWFVLFALITVVNDAVADDAPLHNSYHLYQTTAPWISSPQNQYLPPTEFPSVGSERRYWACLVSSDPINRRGVLRKEEQDRLVEFNLLPSAICYYRGAPAALGDIPPGTMIEVWGYGSPQNGELRNILRLTDDFTLKAFAGQAYRVGAIQADQHSFTATPVRLTRSVSAPYEYPATTTSQLSPPSEETPVLFYFNDQTRWYKGKNLADATDLAVGQHIQLNLIRRFHPGPPVISRVTEVWLDLESQDLASAKQLKSFTTYTRDRGYPLRVDTIDNQKKIMTVSLLETGLNNVHSDWKVGQSQRLAVSTTTLRMWEPAGGQGGPDAVDVSLLAIEDSPVGYGSGGALLTVAVPYLLEGFRPGNILKLYPNGYAIPILPFEERMHSEYDPFLR